MKLCRYCAEKLEDDAKYCSKCGKSQVVQQIETEKTISKTSAPEFKKLDFDSMTPREYFRETAKRGVWTKKNAKELKAFLDKKGMDQKLYPEAEKTIKGMSDLYAEYQKKVSEDRPIEEMQKYLLGMKSKENEMYNNFKKAIKIAQEKEEKRQEGKQKFNGFNEKKDAVYKILKNASPNDGSCDDKDCGYNNCYALAMKIAAKKEDYDSCPYVDD
jgi:hypothetical protein